MNEKFTSPGTMPVFNYAFLTTWQNPPSRRNLLNIYQAQEIYRVLFLPSFSSEFWLTIGKRKNGGFVEIFIIKEEKLEEVNISKWEFYNFKIKFCCLGGWSLMPRGLNLIDGMSYWFEFITFKQYRFVGFGYDCRFNRQNLLMKYFMNTLIKAAEREKSKEGFMSNTAKIIKSYL